jgi:hypothetical protein
MSEVQECVYPCTNTLAEYLDLSKSWCRDICLTSLPRIQVPTQVAHEKNNGGLARYLEALLKSEVEELDSIANDNKHLMTTSLPTVIREYEELLHGYSGTPHQ